jgi:phosphoribosylglycinamide formyltransferase-1
VFGSKENIPAMDIAKENLVPTFPPLLDRSKITVLNERKVDLIVLAGYLKKISPMIISEYKNKIINIHPSLLPKFGGKGMYGIDVHKAVIKAKETVSGATVHYVNEKYDGKLVIGEPFYRIMGGHNKLYNFVLKSVFPRKKLFSKAWEKVHESTI